MQSVMNLKIKFRESFRPFAPSVLEERAPEYFAMAPAADSPYMLLVTAVEDAKRVNGSEPGAGRGLESLREIRSEIPAITHVDFSARVQTVDEGRNQRYAKLLRAFERLTGCPVVINTSFNVRGEPIVLGPREALRCFLNTDMDVLVLEHCVLHKTEQPAQLVSARESYLSEFALD